MSRPAISQHLRVLEGADLVEVRKAGTRRLYKARPERLRAVVGQLEDLWDDSLARLKETVEKEAKR